MNGTDTRRMTKIESSITESEIQFITCRRCEMYTLKVITTVLILFLMLTILLFSRGLHWKRDKATIIGFGFMEIVYILSLICMWA